MRFPCNSLYIWKVIEVYTTGWGSEARKREGKECENLELKTVVDHLAKTNLSMADDLTILYNYGHKTEKCIFNI